MTFRHGSQGRRPIAMMGHRLVRPVGVSGPPVSFISWARAGSLDGSNNSTITPGDPLPASIYNHGTSGVPFDVDVTDFGTTACETTATPPRVYLAGGSFNATTGRRTGGIAHAGSLTSYAVAVAKIGRDFSFGSPQTVIKAGGRVCELYANMPGGPPNPWQAQTQPGPSADIGLPSDAPSYGQWVVAEVLTRSGAAGFARLSGPADSVVVPLLADGMGAQTSSLHYFATYGAWARFAEQALCVDEITDAQADATLAWFRERYAGILGTNS